MRQGAELSGSMIGMRFFWRFGAIKRMHNANTERMSYEKNAYDLDDCRSDVLIGRVSVNNALFGRGHDHHAGAWTKLELITWKGDNLWYCTRPMRPEETPEVHTYEESTNFGVLEGIVTIVEQEPADD